MLSPMLNRVLCSFEHSNCRLISFMSFCVGSGKRKAGEEVAAAASDEDMEKREGVAMEEVGTVDGVAAVASEDVVEVVAGSEVPLFVGVESVFVSRLLAEAEQQSSPDANRDVEGTRSPDAIDKSLANALAASMAAAEIEGDDGAKETPVDADNGAPRDDAFEAPANDVFEAATNDESVATAVDEFDVAPTALTAAPAVSASTTGGSSNDSEDKAETQEFSSTCGAAVWSVFSVVVVSVVVTVVAAAARGVINANRMSCLSKEFSTTEQTNSSR